MKALRVIAVVFGAYAVLGLCLDAAIGHFQPRGGNTAVLRTFDAGGHSKDSVLGLLDDNGQLWVESGHWFRGWYRRALANPDVELVRGSDVGAYRAVPVNTPEAIDTVTRLMGKGSGAAYWAGRLMLLWAPIKPLRLDARATRSPPVPVPPQSRPSP